MAFFALVLLPWGAMVASFFTDEDDEHSDDTDVADGV
jgi:hypothetical protein